MALPDDLLQAFDGLAGSTVVTPPVMSVIGDHDVTVLELTSTGPEIAVLDGGLTL